MPSPNRRDVLATLAGAAALPLTAAPTPSTLIKDENAKPGTPDWQLTYTRVDPKTQVPLAADRGLRLAAQRPGRRDARLLRQHRPAVAVRHRPLPPRLLPGQGRPARAAARAVRRARRSRRRRSARSGCASASGSRAPRSTIPKDWVSGVYLGKLSATKHRYQSYVIFIVRDDRPADFLFQCSDNTWQAYNHWPDNYSLYANDRKDGKVARLRRAGQLRPAVRQVRADLRQPAVAGLGRVPALGVPARVLDGAARLRRHLLLERRRPRRRQDACCGPRAFLSVGHDEYWSRRAVRPRAGGGQGGRQRRRSCRATPAAS